MEKDNVQLVEKIFIINDGITARDNTNLVYLERIAIENNCIIKSIKWRSKYISDVVYDYEPFCSDGFEILFKIVGYKKNINFVEQLYGQRLKNVEFLEKCL